NQFNKIGEVRAVGNTSNETHYSFIDLENSKNGIRYYRLKIVENDGRTSYSPVRPVLFNNDITWQSYPNPSRGLYNFVYQANAGADVQIKVYDASGRVVKQQQLFATGLEQKIQIDLQNNIFSAGI